MTVGLGGITPEKFQELKIKFSETILEGYDYGDANNQTLIWQKPELTELVNKINGYVTKAEYKFELNRIDRAKFLLNLIENEPNFNDLLNNSNQGQLKLLNILAISSNSKYLNYDYFKEFLNLEADIVTQLGNFQGYYNKKYFTPYDLKDLDKVRIDTITLNNVIICYERQYFTFEDLKGLDNKKIELLASATSTKGYEEQYFSFENLKDLDNKKIELLVSDASIKGYENQYFTFENLKDLDNKKIELLASATSIKGYYKQYFSFKSLKDLDLDKLTTVILPEIIKFYECNYFKFEEFVELDIKKIKNICDNLAGYKILLQKYCTFSDLKYISLEKIKVLKNLTAGYDNKYFTFNDLKDIDIEKIQILTGYYVMKGYQKYFKLIDLKNLDDKRIKLLTSENSIKVYENQYCTFNDLKDLNFDKLKIASLMAYDIIKFKDFVELDLERMHVIYDNRLACNRLLIEKHCTFNDLKDLSLDKLKIASLMAYDIIKFKDFVELDLEGMHVIYDNRLACNRLLIKKHCTFNDLKNINVNKIKALTSDIAVMCYRFKYCTFNDLQDLNIKNIKTLISKKAYLKYKFKALKFEDFKASLEKIDIADKHEVEVSENPNISSFTDSIIHNHNYEEDVDMIGRDL